MYEQPIINEFEDFYCILKKIDADDNLIQYIGIILQKIGMV
ncbi:hypothetical protein [uncultured Clostridium sp.]|nr:hypothetical protein [uncultured Clostridium sp.]